MTVIDVTAPDLEALVANLHPDQRDELMERLLEVRRQDLVDYCDFSCPEHCDPWGDDEP